MRVSDATIEKILLDNSKIKKDDIKKLEEQVKQEKKPLQDIVVRDKIISDRDLTKLYATEFDYPYAEIQPRKLKKEYLKLIPERIARQYHVVVVDKVDDVYSMAMEDPDDVQAIDFLKKQIGEKIKVFIAPKDDILAALDQYRQNITSEITDVVTSVEGSEEDQVNEEDLTEDSPIAQTVNLIIEYAIKTGASDVHIEPRDKNVQVRYRVDGVLHEANKLPKKVHPALVSRIKILANLKIDERRAPQDGRFKININDRTFAFRVSILPLVDGEKVVMRVLDESSEALSLESLGFWGTALDTLNKIIQEPHGMILVTGPTGSGKSTTLHSILSLLNKPDINISTVEDPVEYKLEGVNQTQTNPKAGMSFAVGLRSLLRQDPDIMMVGEIRDSETANLCVQAALTGHLVMSTLHTNNAATTLPRLLDMGIEPFLIASTVRGVVGQRLVRKVNAEGSEQYKPGDVEMKQIEKAFGITSDAEWKAILDLANTADTSLKLKTKQDIKLWKPKTEEASKGQPAYKGRIGIYEVLINTNTVQKLIVANATSSEINQEAIKSNMITMYIDGLVKAIVGLTSIEEVLRVTRD